MYSIKETYGKKTFDVWNRCPSTNLEGTETDDKEADSDEWLWPVSSFPELIESVSFLGAMNKRTNLFYRGQTANRDPIPSLFRDGWTCFDTETEFSITDENRTHYWEKLPEIGRRVFHMCNSQEFGLPRWRGLRDIREVQWAIIQHYQLWPTPLIDISSSLRTAAAFAMNCKQGSEEKPVGGYLYVVGMPYTTGSITFDIDSHIVLASLSSACPPVAKRPHYQEGYLVGHIPMDNVNQYVDYEKEEGKRKELLKDKCRLSRRLIAKFKLIDKGAFWSKDFPLFTEEVLYPKQDPLREAFKAEFGQSSRNSLLAMAKTIGNEISMGGKH